jgi:hypothetical protein
VYPGGEALGPLDEAIQVKDEPEVACLTIAINAKIEALSGLGQSRCAGIGFGGDAKSIQLPPGRTSL